jgi:hypothetical protein
MNRKEMDDLAKRAWTIVLVLVFFMAVVASSLLWFFGVPAFAIAAGCVLLFVVFAFFMQLGYFVKVPGRSVLLESKSRQDLAKLASYLCLDSSGDSIELRREIESFISKSEGRLHVWVAPKRLTSALKRMRLLHQSEAEARPKDASNSATCSPGATKKL